ncbi:hypothetical protein YPPY66_2633 [Yersinia pestis PY-66]|uniref:Uncharacterized protein n=1 Tax=Yersinia pestis PY-08 TaxID=992134 RepID=A0AB72ZIY5_YERPE|nr:hypothetical protein YPPY01_2340 [Yersinia pestis PY-01]EIQ90020.1 hypothetical protein YPPY02_2372 [Yersinia pestis PY-02]EIQ90917.1 hypothetical protein YPPY03_2423 [Yersinia pestis PY-03]EIR03785.1 hypothetical protein YPPY05_2371 [Yersinia pestis PY-05]EIR06732.1 hypothetical protein YPPY06_2437 [Yersinia pestis PY-06]EIR17777.1 hypothetical protein YPPY07_2301 [Yersinia pestis PY-07]EIR18596.1 hypothetical protein YPPY08_2414 [Yersinia pestis PY-08]EIR20597.1 hypothetical protein YPP
MFVCLFVCLFVGLAATPVTLGIKRGGDYIWLTSINNGKLLPLQHPT